MSQFMGFQHTTWLEKVANPVDREAEERGQRNVIVHWLSFDSSQRILCCLLRNGYRQDHRIQFVRIVLHLVSQHLCTTASQSAVDICVGNNSNWFGKTTHWNDSQKVGNGYSYFQRDEKTFLRRETATISFSRENSEPAKPPPLN